MKHGKMLRRLTALALSAAMAVSSAFAADGAISGSKSSSPLDENNTATIELSLPADQEQLETDVVFVLDKSTSPNIEDQILEMLKSLSTQITATGAKVNVGVVIFNKEANSVLQLTELNSSNMSKIEDAIKTEISSGTNTHAGLLAGKEMLDSHTAVDANRKYMIFVSDGITYMYDEEPTAIGLQNGDKTNIFAGPDNWSTKYGDTTPPDNWSEWLSHIEQQLTADSDYGYDYPYGTNFNGTGAHYIAYDERADHAMSIDKALYLTHQVYQQMKDEGYHCYAMTASTAANYPWATSFMSYLANGQDVDFTEIQNDIWYLVDKGSEIKDVMGHGTIDGHSYNFVIKSIDSLTINDEKLELSDSSDIENGTYTFKADGEVHSIITVAENKKSFDWKIEQPITNFARVKLTYTVELQGDILGQEGTFGVYDQYGNENHEGLVTNESATLTTQDGTEFTFSQPTVSYGGIVIDPGDDDDNPSGGDNDKPSGGGDNDRYEGPDLTVVKVDEDGETIESNARFRIYKEQGSKTMWYKGNQSWSEDEEDAWIFNTSVGDGSFTAYDLKPGTYYIVEVSAPEGYDLAEEPLEVEVENRDVTVEFVNSGDGVVTTPTKPVPDTGR